jgi:prepilin-type N-terminal cleavage/methylation domain-containing protein
MSRRRVAPIGTSRKLPARRPARGFTLIELLIVVAIIAILAAIAVPNFLEAQTRSKVSRVQADFRAMAVAIEMYLVDHNSYPIDQDDRMTSTSEDGYRMLTTPIAYMSAGRNLRDPFNQELRNTNDFDSGFYQIASGVNPDRRDESRTRGRTPIQAYATFSYGPAYTGEDSTQRTMINDDWPFKRYDDPGTFDPLSPVAMDYTITALYDPTNGTSGKGVIIRFGGAYNEGDWTIEGMDHREWGVRMMYP